MSAALLHDRAEMIRYVVNGLCATAVHFGVLTFGLEVIHLPSAGVANFIAAIFGITTSFVGNRWYVFRGHSDPILSHIWRFGLLYAVIACLHAGLLYVWSDRLGFNYIPGFVIATGMQMALSYVGNKLLVFG